MYIDYMRTLVFLKNRIMCMKHMKQLCSFSLSMYL